MLPISHLLCSSLPVLGPLLIMSCLPQFPHHQPPNCIPCPSPALPSLLFFTPKMISLNHKFDLITLPLNTLPPIVYRINPELQALHNLAQLTFTSASSPTSSFQPYVLLVLATLVFL